MRAGLLPLVQHGNGNFTKPFANVGSVLEQLAETDGARKPRRACSDDEDANLDALVLGIARRGDVVRGPKRRRKVCGFGHPALRALTSSVSFGTSFFMTRRPPR